MNVAGSVASMDQIPWVYLLLIALVVAFGLGVLVLQRRGREDESAQRGEHPGAVAPPAARSVVVQEDEGAPEVDEVVAVGEVADDVGVAPVEPPASRSMRERLARARSALSGAIGSVLGRSAIDAATWDELEEALLLADVGVGVATALLDPLRDRVTSGSIESPEQLIDALRDEMFG
ncbi:MAG: signal recognition particle-docking protein FtsY, partial [Alphaproteobacteria bacterium]|nr:signal recognition particle-docking protein FtsY [Alphaproteobacteria bacterium]